MSNVVYIEGGTGNDTLTYTDVSSGTDELNFVSGIENVVFGDATTTVQLDNSLADVGDIVTVDGSALTGSHTLTFNATNGEYNKYYITGGHGDDILSGSILNDTLIGGLGDDVIEGGESDDTMTGGGGADKFLYSSSSEPLDATLGDKITDFISGTDQI